MNQKERMLGVMRGAMVDRIPYAPRIDLWFHSNKLRGTLPEQYQNVESGDEIALAEGWALHKVVLEFMTAGEEGIIDRCLGVYRIPSQGFLSNLSDDVERRVKKQGEEYHVEYRTPVGNVSGIFVFTEEMKHSGVSIPWIKEHLLKRNEDYRTLGYIYEHMKVEPAYDGFSGWSEGIGDNGLPVIYASTSGSPMHHIMKLLVDSTDFYYQFKDHNKEMLGLADQMSIYFNKVIDVVSESPADALFFGANFDDMLTYPPFFKEHIQPWLILAADKFHSNNKLLMCHTDGENKGLMDLLYNCGMDVADSVCPHPMTKVTLAEYYSAWSDKITIFGGVPSNLMLEDSFTDDEFEQYMDELFTVIHPGSKFIMGIADTTPPNASFKRMQRIQELVLERGRLPLGKNEDTVISVHTEYTPKESSIPKAEVTDKADTCGGDLPFCKEIREGVLAGDHINTIELVKKSLELNVDPERLLNECMLAPMDVIGAKFTDGTVFIPEVLLSARVLNEAMTLLEPVLSSQRTSVSKTPLVLLGTVKGDMHDIGKNLVGIMLKSVGFKVKDLGINVPAERFVEEVAAEKPQILALSALLTTTMPEFKNVIEALQQNGLRDNVKIMVGGAPVSEGFARSIGADAYGADAGQAAARAKDLCLVSA